MCVVTALKRVLRMVPYKPRVFLFCYDLVRVLKGQGTAHWALGYETIQSCIKWGRQVKTPRPNHLAMQERKAMLTITISYVSQLVRGKKLRWGGSRHG